MRKSSIKNKKIVFGVFVVTFIFILSTTLVQAQNNFLNQGIGDLTNPTQPTPDPIQLTPEQINQAGLSPNFNNLSPQEQQAVLLQIQREQTQQNNAEYTKNLSEGKETNNGECWVGLLNGGINLGNCFRSALAWLGAILVYLFTQIVYFANELFNESINVSVRNFSQYANSEAVQTSWGVIRDLVNMGFIFVLIYIAIGTILNVQKLNWKKLVPTLIVVALLVNFSAFFTRVIIDVSNVTSNQFYLSAANGKTAWGSPDITSALFKNISVYNKQFASSGQKTVEEIGGGLNSWQIIVSTFGGVVLALIASFVLFTGAILFVARTIRLLFLIVLSPFAFFFFILPNTSKHAETWLKALMNDATFAPAFLIMIYIVTQITSKTSDDGSIIFFMLVMGLLLGAIVVAKSVGAAGASGAMKLAGATNAAIAGGALWTLKQGRRGVVAGVTGGVGLAASPLGKGASTRKYALGQLKNIGADVRDMYKGSGQTKLAKAIKTTIKEPGRTILTKASDIVADQTEPFGVPVGFLGDTEKQRKDSAKSRKDAEKEEKEKKEEEKGKKVSITKDTLKNINRKNGTEISELQKKITENRATGEDKNRMNLLLKEIADSVKDLDNRAKAKLGGDILSMPGLAGVLEPKDLAQIRRDTELTDEQTKKIREAVIANKENNLDAYEYLTINPENRNFWKMPKPQPNQQVSAIVQRVTNPNQNNQTN